MNTRIFALFLGIFFAESVYANNDTRFFLAAAPSGDTIDLSVVQGTSSSERLSALCSEITRGIQPAPEDDPAVLQASSWDNKLVFQNRPSRRRHVEAALLYKLSKNSAALSGLEKELQHISRVLKKEFPLKARAEYKIAFLSSWVVLSAVAGGSLLYALAACGKGLYGLSAAACGIGAAVTYLVLRMADPAVDMLMFWPHYGLDDTLRYNALMCQRVATSIKKFRNANDSLVAAAGQMPDGRWYIESPLLSPRTQRWVIRSAV